MSTPRYTLKRHGKFFSGAFNDAGSVMGFIARGITACYSYSSLEEARRLQAIHGGDIVEVISTRASYFASEGKLVESFPGGKTPSSEQK